MSQSEMACDKQHEELAMICVNGDKPERYCRQTAEEMTVTINSVWH